MENKAQKEEGTEGKPRRKGSIEQEESAPESSKPGEGEVPTNEENKEEEEDTSCCSLRWQKETTRKKEGKVMVKEKKKDFHCGWNLCCFPCCGKEED